MDCNHCIVLLAAHSSRSSATPPLPSLYLLKSRGCQKDTCCITSDTLTEDENLNNLKLETTVDELT